MMILNLALLAVTSLVTVSAFNFPDLNIYEESSSTMNSACSLFAAMIEWINYSDPQIEKVSFEMRTDCERIEFGVSEADLFRYWSGFNESLKTVIVIGGWNSHVDSPYIEDLTKAYLCRGGYNLIVVDTSDYVRTEYIKSAYNTEKLGKFVAIGLKKIEIPGKDIHIIGHSLGAHIAGSAARHFTAETGDKIGRVTGLDPARPCFFNHSVFTGLKQEDATFVDIIHSNSGEAGLEELVGHIDFFPGGLEPQQVGCSSVNLACSHLMSINYYIESVYKGNEENFMASKCGNYTDLQALNCHGGPQVPMGLSVPETAKGIYLLTVNKASPYGMNATNTDYEKTNAECGICNV